MSEELYAPIIRAVNATGCAFVWRNQSGGVPTRGGWMTLSPKGTPDIVGWMARGPKSGAAIGLEVKVGKGKATPEQTEHLERLARAGGVTGVVVWPHEAIAIVLRAAGLERKAELERLTRS